MLTINDLHFSYPEDGFSLHIPALHVAAGETLAITGPSGSGKTTLLNLIAGILAPKAGTLQFDGTELRTLHDARLRELRITRMGLVFQEFELLEYLNVLDNMLLPYRISDALLLTDSVSQSAAHLADLVGIGGKLDRFPDKLSQGERQRVALCRALITNPKLILADEPTGNLDPANKGRALDFLFDYVRTNNAALITVTHDHQLISRFDRVIDFQEFLPGSETDTTGASA